MKIQHIFLIVVLATLLSLAISYFTIMLFAMQTGSSGGVGDLAIAISLAFLYPIIILFLIGPIYLVLRLIPMFKNPTNVLASILLLSIVYGGLYIRNYWQSRQKRLEIASIHENKQETYNELKSQGYFPKPTYLPELISKPPLSDISSLTDKYTDKIFEKIEYACIRSPARLHIEYYYEKNQYYGNKDFYTGKATNPNIQSDVASGRKTIERITVNGNIGYFLSDNPNTEDNPKDHLSWLKDKIVYIISADLNCKISKEELIKIAESMK